MKISRYKDIEMLSESEIKIKNPLTTLVVNIGEKTFYNREASQTFVEVIEEISSIVGVDKFIEDNSGKIIKGGVIVGQKKEDFANYNYATSRSVLKKFSKNKPKETLNFLVNTHSNTERKKQQLEYLFNLYNIDGKVSIRNRVDGLESDGEDDENFIEKKMTFLVASQHVLKQNGNIPMNANEIWEEIKKHNLVNTTGLTPWDTINAQMILSSINTSAKGKKKNSIFKIVDGTKPYKFILLNPDNIQNVPDEDEIEDTVENIEKSAINPFGGESMNNSNRESSAICVLGKSGAGKTYRIEKTLNKENHISEIIIPSSSTTNLLVQYTQGKYVLSRLGKFILAANSDKTKCYTVVFDECHKYIEMINDELLQCISTKRNDGLRFISLDPVTDELFEELPEKNGRRIISENLGFIFISSKEEVIKNNSDFYNRVDVITIDKSDRDIEFAIEILKDKIESREDEGYSMEE